MAGLYAEAQRTDGPGDKNFACTSFTRFAGDFYAAGIEALHFLGQAERRQLKAIRAKRVGLDDMRAGFDVSLMNTEDGFRFGRVQFIEAPLRANSFVK